MTMKEIGPVLEWKYFWTRLCHYVKTEIYVATVCLLWFNRKITLMFNRKGGGGELYLMEEENVGITSQIMYYWIYFKVKHLNKYL